MIKQNGLIDFPVQRKVIEHTVAVIMSCRIQQQQPSFQETSSVFHQILKREAMRRVQFTNVAGTQLSSFILHRLRGGIVLMERQRRGLQLQKAALRGLVKADLKTGSGVYAEAASDFCMKDEKREISIAPEKMQLQALQPSTLPVR